MVFGLNSQYVFSWTTMEQPRSSPIDVTPTSHLIMALRTEFLTILPPDIIVFTGLMFYMGICGGFFRKTLSRQLSLQEFALFVVAFTLLWVSSFLITWTLIILNLPCRPVTGAHQLLTLLLPNAQHIPYNNSSSCPPAASTFEASGWDKIETYGLVPEFCPCPKAWKDDAADYVWWLA